MATRPVSMVPRPVLLALAGALALQLWWQAAQPAPPARAEQLGTPPSMSTLRLASLGEPVAVSKLMLLHLQSHDDQPGAAIAFGQLDYTAVRAWLARILELDPRAQAPLLAASQVYGAVDDPARVRLMLDFVHARFDEDPDRRWPWLAHAALVARHRLHDLPLARSYAQAIRLRATGPGVPAWARQLEIVILEDMDEQASARALIGGLIESGQVTDPNELRFLERRLKKE